MNIKEVIDENRRRNDLLVTPYDPLTGAGCCGDRVVIGDCRLPRSLLDAVPCYASLSPVEQNRRRIEHDFEFWAATCATIKDKVSCREVRFVLNAPQRRLLSVMERQRQAGQPVRVILLKARQWGGSTLVQMYMAWLQIVVHKQWNSLICGHLRQSSRAIKRMYNLLLRRYPPEYLDEGVKLEFRNFEGSNAVQELKGRDCLVVMGSSRSEDAVRGYDLAMAHLTEVAYWASSAMHSPEDVVRSVAGTVTMMPDTVVVYESTANGVGNFFHSEWLRAKSGACDKIPVFVPWYEIEIYRSRVDDAEALWQSMDDYEHALWDEGCTLEMINWYHHKRREYSTHSLMMAEFPSNDIEAFAGSGNGVFDTGQLERLRGGCCPPVAVGDIEGDYLSDRHARFVPKADGPMKVWAMPEHSPERNRYLVSVDIGGRSDKADYSVIAVFDIHNLRDNRPEVVAQWRGHIDHDLLAWKAAQTARVYDNALLVIESNTLETEQTDGGAGEFILGSIGRAYGNIYRRGVRRIPGFQTNRKTKRFAIYSLIAAIRDAAYVERDHDAVDEMVTYRRTTRGGYEAMKGKHDDILMTRAIALAVIAELKTAIKPRTITPEDKAALVAY
ncbi:MAG: hypothetical protein KBT10_07330 [Bacteroidales bacterium]|nr:hypothetical protein [Candidatus Sodaliphilus aphodohippi]